MESVTPKKLHASETLAYWLRLAAHERAKARLPYKTVDSIDIHLAEARQYEEQAARLQARGQ